MADTTLEKLFESKVRAHLLRTFFMSPGSEFRMEDLARAAKIRSQALKNELKKFLKMGLIQTKTVREVSLSVRHQKQRKGRARKKVRITKHKVFSTNRDFLFFPELQNLVSRIAPKAHAELLGRIKRLGDIRLAILSGVFLQNSNGQSRADIVIVGDRLHRVRVTAFLKRLQEEIGKELNYAVMSTQEFQYRNEMNDRFVRDVLESPHEKLIDKMRI